MIGIVLALTASGLWGSADFLAGRAARNVPVLTVTLVSQAAGLAALLVVVPLVGGVSVEPLAWGTLAGLAGVGAVLSFYRALALGAMGVVAPIVATSAAIPVVAGFIVNGERPSPSTLAGMALAMSGVIAASRAPGPSRTRGHRDSLVLALIAALLLGLQLVFLNDAGQTAPLAGVAASRATSMLFVAAVTLARRAAISPCRIRPLAVVGLIDTGANVAFSYASNFGLLTLVAVLASLYPVVTVTLAYVKLSERLTRLQTVGIATTLLGVAVMTAAS